MSDIHQGPAYAAALEDAKRGEPLFDTASPACAAGWLAYWSMREFVRDLYLHPFNNPAI